MYDQMFGQLAENIISIVMAKVEERLAEQAPVAREGFIVENTWNPQDGTASVAVSDTITNFTDDGDGPIVIPSVPIHQPHVGDQAGPDGDERVHLEYTQSGFVAKMYHGPDDSPGAAVGERLITRKSRIRLKTVAGGVLDMNDAAKVYSLTSPGGLMVVLDDNAKEVYLGKNGLSSLDSVMTQSDSQKLANDLVANVQAAFTTFASHVMSGNGTAPPTVAQATAKGSSTVEAKE